MLNKRKFPLRSAFAIAFAIAILVRPLPANAEISVRTAKYDYPYYNPDPTQANMQLLTAAIYRLAADPRLTNHPIRRYLNDPGLKTEIIFDNLSAAQGALTSDKKVYLRSGEDMAYYLKFLTHEFIHVAMDDKYLQGRNYSFLRPEDFAFQGVMEEAFANAIEIWQRLSYPEMPSDRQIRNWAYQNNTSASADARRNDLRATTKLSEERINAQVAADMFNLMMTNPNPYTTGQVPKNMRTVYRNLNTFLVPEYNVYAARNDALLRHQWNYLASMMPFELPRDKNFDYYRSRFKSDVAFWAHFANSPEESIQYWLDHPYKSEAFAKFNNLYATNPAKARLDYLDREDEERMNQVMRELDPYFIPVNTAAAEWRIWQERQQASW